MGCNRAFTKTFDIIIMSKIALTAVLFHLHFSMFYFQFRLFYPSFHLIHTRLAFVLELFCTTTTIICITRRVSWSDLVSGQIFGQLNFFQSELKSETLSNKNLGQNLDYKLYYWSELMLLA
jgi:uncharacterized membrane protein (UPF0136 family)